MSLLTLNISNLGQLKHNATARHQFDDSGGTIGSAGATWLIDDRDQTVAPIHCEIRWIEGDFCVIDRCQRTYLNGNLDSVGPLNTRRLLDGDQLRIGALRLLVQLSQADTRSLEDMFSPDQRSLDHWLHDVPAAARQAAPATREFAVEICSAFDPGVGSDPLAALDAVAVKRTEQVDPLQAVEVGAHP